ncbi:MAG: hypothetical protein NC099_03090 [Corallococcus sp.]|nr:hypothetical protein [Bacillota bacterium]MCM1533619.1 hypothetical protein [Corallococcus sp.]
MKDKRIFKKNMFKVTIICLAAAVVEEAFFIFFTFNFLEEDKRWFLIFISCTLLSAALCLFWLLLRQYFVVNDETVTYCKLFRRITTVYWKDAEVTETTSYGKDGVLSWVVISDGVNDVKLSSVSLKDIALLKDLCKKAKEKYDVNNITF